MTSKEEEKNISESNKKITTTSSQIQLVCVVFIRSNKRAIYIELYIYSIDVSDDTGMFEKKNGYIELFRSRYHWIIQDMYNRYLDYPINNFSFDSVLARSLSYVALHIFFP